MVRQRGQHHGDLRAALIASALELIDDADVDSLTLRAVARRAGVSPAAPYHHFEDKAALLSSVALDGFVRLAHLQASVRSRTPIRRVEELTAAYIRFALEHRAHYAVMMDSLQSADQPRPAVPLAAELEAAARLTFDHLVMAIGAARPDLSIDETRRRGVQLWAQAHGTVAVADIAVGLDDRLNADVVVAGAKLASRAVVSA
jgi:AcrR family transcriptional regulator